MHFLATAPQTSASMMQFSEEIIKQVNIEQSDRINT